MEQVDRHSHCSWQVASGHKGSPLHALGEYNWLVMMHAGSKNIHLEQLLESLLEKKLARQSKASGKSAEEEPLNRNLVSQPQNCLYAGIL